MRKNKLELFRVNYYVERVPYTVNQSYIPTFYIVRAIGEVDIILGVGRCADDVLLFLLLFLPYSNCMARRRAYGAAA
jgi:hypothetical protein